MNENWTVSLYVFNDGETYSLSKPIHLSVTAEELAAIQSGQKVSTAIPNWDCTIAHNYPCTCKSCTATRQLARKLSDAMNDMKEE